MLWCALRESSFCSEEMYSFRESFLCVCFFVCVCVMCVAILPFMSSQECTDFGQF